MNYKTSTIILGIITLILAGVVITQNLAWQKQARLNSQGGSIPLFESNDIPSTTYDPQSTQPQEEAVDTKPRETNIVDSTNIPWKLVSGDPTDTCTHPKYEGQVSLKGWYVWSQSYIANQWMFRIDAKDLAKTPLDKMNLLSYYQDKPEFVFSNASKELEEELKQATSYEPKEVTITKFEQYCEGSAVLTLKTK